MPAGISQILKPSEMVVVTGKVNRRAEDGAAEILVEEMVPLAQAREQYVSELLVRMSSPGVEDETILRDLKDVLVALSRAAAASAWKWTRRPRAPSSSRPI